MNTLVLQLIGPLQSYGTEKTFINRRTNMYPTKSAIIGLIAAAFGYSRDSVEPQLFNKIKVHVRIDQPGELLIDFQTAKSKNDSYISHREYIQDAKYLVFLETDDYELLNMIYEKLKRPVYAPVLGRRNCIPSKQLIYGIYNKPSLELINTIPLLTKSITTLIKNDFKTEVKLESNQDENYTQDQYNYTYRQYELRPISTMYLDSNILIY